MLCFFEIEWKSRKHSRDSAGAPERPADAGGGGTRCDSSSSGDSGAIGEAIGEALAILLRAACNAALEAEE
jgi:hypothetical protein